MQKYASQSLTDWHQTERYMDIFISIELNQWH